MTLNLIHLRRTVEFHTLSTGGLNNVSTASSTTNYYPVKPYVNSVRKWEISTLVLLKILVHNQVWAKSCCLLVVWWMKIVKPPSQTIISNTTTGVKLEYFFTSTPPAHKRRGVIHTEPTAEGGIRGESSPNLCGQGTQGADSRN